MNRKVLAVAFTLALFGLVFANPVWANQAPAASTNGQAAEASSGGAGVIRSVPSEMMVTVVRPVEIPGHVLQPGEYSFRLNDSDNTVAVSKLDGSEFYGNYFVIPSSRATAETAAVYTEAAPNGIDRIASWYFPGESNGFAFLYPQAKHVQMARATMATR